MLPPPKKTKSVNSRTAGSTTTSVLMTSVGVRTSIVGVFKWDTQLCERVERERAEARRAAGVGPEEWVNDW